MTKRKKLTVKMNGKRLNKHNMSRPKRSHFTQSIYDEHAATTEKIEDQSSFFARKYNDEDVESKSVKFRYNKQLKPMIMAVITAIIIGSILGFILLRMFMSIENGMANPGSDNPIVTLDTASKDSPKKNEDQITLPAIQAYVLQGGVFSEEANAKEYAKLYKNKNLSTVIWQRDNQYFLITGLAHSIDLANDLAKQQEEEGLEVFVKEWKSSSVDVKFKENENEWFQAFHELLTQSIEKVNNNDQMPVNEWQTLLKKEANDTKQLVSFKEKMTSNIDLLKADKQSKVQSGLLNIWYEFERFLNSK